MTVHHQRRRRYCPVCWQTLGPPTRGGHIADHFDSAGRDICPMSSLDYELAGRGRPNPMHDREYHQPVDTSPVAPGIVTALLIDRLGKLLAS